MQEVIKSIIQIDKNAVLKEENAKLMLKELENQKKIKLKEITNELELQAKKEVTRYKDKIEIEINKEKLIIKKEYEMKLEDLKYRYHLFSEKVVKESFDMILRNLEE